MAKFGIFSKTINDLPTQAVLRVLDIECDMLQKDVEHYGRHIREDDVSILCFGHFIRMVKAGCITRFSRILPPDHVEFFKETVVRLTQAGELPSTAMEQFDYAFSLKK